jgi:predicted peptidase
MKFLFWLIILYFLKGTLLAQKPCISDTTSKIWTQVFNGKISPNGKYVDYQIRTTDFNRRTIILTATDKSWEKRFSGAQAPVYSKDGKDAYLILDKKLVKIKLSSDLVDTIGTCDRFELSNNNGIEYLICQTNNPNKLIITKTGDQNTFGLSDVQEYWQYKPSGVFLIKQKKGLESEVLVLYDLKNGAQKTIFQSTNIGNVILGNSGNALAFITEDHGNKRIWYYRFGMDQAKELINDASLRNNLKIATGFWQFSADDNCLLLTLEEHLPAYKGDSQAPDVWSFEDKIVYQKFKNQSFQLSGRVCGENLSTVDVETGKLKMLLRTDEAAVGGIKMFGDLIMIESLGSNDTILLSPNKELKSWSLLDISTMQRYVIKSNVNKGLWNVHISPDKKYLIYFDADEKAWMCFDIAKHQSKVFAESIMSQLFFYQENMRSQNEVPLAIMGWVEGTDHLVMQGTFDLWEVSVTNQIKPIKLTPHKESENLVWAMAIRPKNEIIRPNENLYVYSQNLDTRINGFYRLNIKKQEFKQLLQGSYYWATLYSEVGGAELQKAENADAFLFVEDRVDQSRNYLFATNFKKITKISDNHPEKAYNWIVSELLTYKDAEGNSCHGILYKPENFDPKKKYPVIFNIYQEQSYALNKHLSPEWHGLGISIPYLVSNGYLVCSPDVYIAKGKIGEYAVKSVLAAADHLSKYSWVDSTKMGLTGHSLGGFETNYIITRTNRFAAAMASSSISSMINNYNDLWADGEDKHAYSIRSAPLMGGPMEDYSEAYIDNSPILHTKNITTPLLLIHGDADPNAPFYHSTQLFVQLRSMGKKVWLVSYANEGHRIGSEVNQKDYTYKVTSYFDYYLRGKPKPEWMIKHITF